MGDFGLDAAYFASDRRTWVVGLGIALEASIADVVATEQHQRVSSDLVAPKAGDVNMQLCDLPSQEV